MQPLARLAGRRLPPQHAAVPRQKRGHERQQALLEAGLQLTRTRRWSEVTVADIAGAIGCSVGTFYTRFHTKDDYFHVLQTLLAEVLEQRLEDFHAAPQRTHESATGFIHAWVHLIVNSFCLHRGLYAAAMVQSQSLSPAAMQEMPLRRVRALTTERFVGAMAQRPGWDGPQARLRLGVAHQLVNGLLVNAVLTDPGPLHLEHSAPIPHHDAVCRELARAVLAYLDLPASTTQEQA